MGPVVTVGICVRNGEKLLHHAVDSVIEQDFPLEQLQIVFVDDGSRDKTPKIISDYLSRLSIETKFMQTSWKGLGSARQTVVENASGAYIIWVDCDMVLARDFIRRQVEFMEANSEVGIGKGMYGFNKNEKLVAALENMGDLLIFLAKLNQNQNHLAQEAASTV